MSESNKSSKDDARDAARYRWLRERLEVREIELLAGTFATGMVFRAGGDLFGASVCKSLKANALDGRIDDSLRTVETKP